MEFEDAKKLLESTGHLVVEKREKKIIKESGNYHFERMMKITEILYDNIERLLYDEACDIAEYVSEKLESQDVDREYIAETIEQMLDDCGIRITSDLSFRLAREIMKISEIKGN